MPPTTNTPDLWRTQFPVPDANSHKYTRGTALIRGGAVMTGAARLAARAAQRMGAGLVTIAAPTAALPIYAESLESIIVRPCDTLPQWQTIIDDRHNPALLIGPGLGNGAMAKDEILAALAAKRPTVLDADAITLFADNPDLLFSALHPICVLTPHEGEFVRLFATLADDKISRARAAAKRANCIVVLKGAETIIAAPDGQTIINRSAPPWLATAGSGDVLAGMILGLIAQQMPVFDAACAAAWMHGAIAAHHGPGLIAEDIVHGIPAELNNIFEIKPGMRPQVGIGVIVRRDGKVLLGKRKGEHGAGTWCYPGGHLERGESWDECARRELREETGMEVGALRFLGATNDLYPGGKHYVTIVMLADWVGNEPMLMEPDKCAGWQWFAWDALPEPLLLSTRNFVDLGINPM